MKKENLSPIRLAGDPSQYLKLVEISRDELPSVARCPYKGCNELLEIGALNVNVNGIVLNVAVLVCRKPHTPDMGYRYYRMEEKRIVG